MKPDVLCVWPARPWQLDELSEIYRLHRYDQTDDPHALLEAVAPSIRAVVTTGAKGLDRKLIERLPGLRIVASSGVGYDTIDVAACTERGIKVTNTPDVLNDDVADTAIMLMLASRRRLVFADAYVRSGEWATKGPMPLTSSLAGKTLGIVGLGRIGKAIARRALPLGLSVAYSGRHPQPEIDYEFVPGLVELAGRSDILVAAVSGGEETKGLIGREVLEALGPAGTFINVARGTVVDEAALIDLLQIGALGSAGLDVFLSEPRPDPAFSRLSNVTLHPHHASGTTETRDAMARLVLENLAAFFGGRPLLTPVN